MKKLVLVCLILVLAAAKPWTLLPGSSHGFANNHLSGKTSGDDSPLQVEVHPEETHQIITGFGAGFNQDAQKLMATIASPDDRIKAYDLLYGESGTRLNIIRLVISPNAVLLQGKSSGIRYDWAHDEATQAEWAAIQPILRLTKPVLYAVPFTPPVQWKDNGQLSKGSLKPEYYQEYAGYLVDFLEYYRTVLGVPIDVLSIQNEPGVPAPWQSCVWSGEELRDFLKIIGPVVRRGGMKTEFMLSEGTNWTGAWAHLAPALADPEAKSFLGVMASHSYDDPFDPSRAKFAAASRVTGLPVWTSEMSLMQPAEPDDAGMKAALRVASYIHRDLTQAQASAWIYCFAIFRSKFPGSMGILAPSDGQARGALVVPKRLWAIASFSRFVKPGWKLMGISDSGIENTGFISPDGGSFTIVAINSEDHPREVHYTFGGKKISRIRTFITSENSDLGESTLSIPDAHGFLVTLMPGSVTAFTGIIVQ